MDYEPIVVEFTEIFKKIFIAQTVSTVCTRIIYTIVPVTSLNKYLNYGTSCLFVRFPAVTTHCGCIFHSPVAGF